MVNDDPLSAIVPIVAITQLPISIVGKGGTIKLSATPAGNRKIQWLWENPAHRWNDL